MNKPLILVVEDDAPIRNLMTTTLKAHDYRYLVADCGEAALREASTSSPDIMLLDLGLPDLDGVEVIRRVRSWSDLPIIVISARSEDAAKIEALDSGADDYLTKPFSVEELLARLRVTQRRLAAMHTGGSPVFTNGQLTIDFAAGCAFLNGQELHLTPIEYKLLCLMAHNCGKVLTHTYITQKVWGTSWENDVASLRVFMATLRKKLESAPGSPQYIQTHIGVRDQTRFENIVRFVMSNIGNLTSCKNIADVVNASPNTIRRYLRALEDAFLIYKVPRYDIRGKKLLKTREKYYVSDTGIRNTALGLAAGDDISRQLENLVYLELIRRGYRVTVGSYRDREVDFTAVRNGEVEYFQVTQTMLPENVYEREVRSLRDVGDNFPKTVLSLDQFQVPIGGGIKHRNIVDWLLGKE